jgi:hypothetical protein
VLLMGKISYQAKTTSQQLETFFEQEKKDDKE